MAVSARFDIEGIPELKAALKRAGAVGGRKIMREAVNSGLTVMLSAVDRNTPVGETGNLKRHNKKQIWEEKTAFVDGEVLNNANHAHLVEFGHGGRNPAPPHPFVRPAFDMSRSRAQAAVSAFLKGKLESA